MRVFSVLRHTASLSVFHPHTVEQKYMAQPHKRRRVERDGAAAGAEHDVDDQARVHSAPPSSPASSSSNGIGVQCVVVVSNLPAVAPEQAAALAGIFAPFGDVVSFTPVEGDATVAVVVFATPGGAGRALKMHGVDLGFGSPVYVRRPRQA